MAGRTSGKATSGIIVLVVGVAVALLAVALVGWWLVDSARDRAYDDAEDRLTARSYAARHLLGDLMFDVEWRPPIEQAAAERCGLGGALVPAITFVVVDEDGSVVCDESGGLADDPETLGEWVVANADPRGRMLAIDVPGARLELVDIVPLDDRWVVGVEIPRHSLVWFYLDVRDSFLVDPDGRVIAEESPIDAPEVVTVPDGGFARIEVPERGEFLATSSNVPTTGDWRAVLALPTSDIEDQARRQWGPAVVVLAVMTVLGLVILTATLIASRRWWGAEPALASPEEDGDDGKRTAREVPSPA